MSSNATQFVIPENLRNVVPCQKTPDLYSNPALDIDIDDDDWILLPRDAQFVRLAAKQTAERAAIAACNTCPLLASCDQWASSLGSEISGIIGGRDQNERLGNTNEITITDYTERGPLGQVRDDLIERWAVIGVSNQQIAERLDCTVRTVERRRAGLAAGTITTGSAETYTPPAPTLDANTLTNQANPNTTAKVPLIANRVTIETAAMFDVLADGNFHDRQTVLAAALPLVDRDQAINTAPKNRKYADDNARINVGARKFLMNRLDIAIRRGRIQTVTSDSGTTFICLETETVTTWADWKANLQNAI